MVAVSGRWYWKGLRSGPGSPNNLVVAGLLVRPLDQVWTSGHVAEEVARCGLTIVHAL